MCAKVFPIKTMPIAMFFASACQQSNREGSVRMEPYIYISDGEEVVFLGLKGHRASLCFLIFIG